ncbi:MAG: hypothetical protein WAO91_02420 [Candidatus Nitrosotenuis sp.]
MPDENISQLRDILDDIRAMLLLTNQDKIDEAKKKLLKSGSVEETVYKMCEVGVTNEEIASQLQKDAKYARAVVSNLKQKGLIKTVERDGKKIHEHRF